MSFLSNVPETSDRYGEYVSEFEELFRNHEVSFGKAEDFFKLAPKLAYDGEFRTAFAGLTESVKKREDGKLTLTGMLTIIAIAMGGPEIETLGSASAVPISLVVVFLAGVGDWSETEPEIVPKAPQELPAADRSVAAESNQEEEREADVLEQRLASGPSHNLNELTAYLFAGPALLMDALSRLERNTLELKYHLESIEQRIERFEPQNHLDQIASRMEPPPDVRPRSQEYEQTTDMTPALRFTQPELVAPSLEELAAVGASFQERKLPETESVETDESNLEDRSAIEAMLPAAELERAEPVKIDALVVADRYEAAAMPHTSELPKEDVVAPVVEKREDVDAKVQSLERLFLED